MGGLNTSYQMQEWTNLGSKLPWSIHKCELKNAYQIKEAKEKGLPLHYWLKLTKSLFGFMNVNYKI